MRADRLLAILMYLQTHGQATAARLADEFEVSRRTLLRDIYSLRVAGFPVETTPGPTGGCSLPDSFRNRLTALKADELATLLLSSIHHPLKELGLSSPLQSARLKLAATTADERKQALQQFESRLLIDSAPWPHQSEQSDELSILFQACMEDRWIHAEFTRPFGVVTSHRIAPHALVSKAGVWYCVWADESAGYRVDRVSRIRSARIDSQTFERSEEFDLQSYWQDWLDRRISLEPAYVVSLRVRSDALNHVRAMLRPSQVDVATPRNATPDWIDASVTFSYFDEARTNLLPLGCAVEVLKPRALRVSMADFGARILSTYE